MFRILTRLRKIGIRILQHRILIAMPQLFLHPNISGNRVIFDFNGPLGDILIG